MEIFREIKPLRAFLREKNKAGFLIGFVPTMGALHEGHLSLIEASKKLGCFTVCSIFVNPAQFNNADDLKKYPRNIEEDIKLLEEAKCDALFAPNADEIYPHPSNTHFDFGSLGTTMEGEFRPGHFSGVALVVSKLFHIIEPDHAFFGQKDWQQVTIINQLVKDLNFDIQLHPITTLREKDGLAMSSRNQRLTEDQRSKSIVFYQSLLDCKARLEAGERLDKIAPFIKNKIEQDSELRLEYLQLANRENLSSLNSVEEPNNAVLCIAGFVGDVRLIDNILL
ncbi:pantoate--beta-alanine ligase [Chryseotalea sanaruensis]|uniref:Pantothenate synthetase n=1 Tax=Chryseotalea sanaruensis TaxID=2482724 RepID=A0A401UCE8_9BACT|nr:pantoate--beta-alanine ligase [Chryseotalea sanaruensis]GCC52568.1 pantoate--beta-alanine ligase [Chryseotalea sanaruensis]